MKRVLLCSLGCLMAVAVQAKTLTVSVYRVAQSGQGKKVGTVVLQDTAYGVLIKPDLRGLTPGLHGFHVHQKASCDRLGQAAGGHLDPSHTQKHLGPYAKGHLGDLPVLYVNAAGVADVTTLAPRVTVNQLKGHAIMVHQGGDNYSDVPKPLGGGGARVACGVI